jgi:hypothetical protein
VSNNARGTMCSPPLKPSVSAHLHANSFFYTHSCQLPIQRPRERHARAVFHMPLRHPLHGGLLTSHALHMHSSTLSQLSHTSLTRFHPPAFLRSRPMSAIGTGFGADVVSRVWVAVAWSQVALLASGAYATFVAGCL